MKRWMVVVVVMGLAVGITASGWAGETFLLKGREIYAGVDTPDGTAGALFVGNFFDSRGVNRGYFSLSLDHDGQGIESCGAPTGLIKLKLVLNFSKPLARLVLTGPAGGEAVSAHWDWNDPACEQGGCPLIGYGNYLDPDLDPAVDLVACMPEGPAFIAEISEFSVVKQWLGSFGTRFRGGSVRGWLDHTPIISPAVVGIVDLHE